MGPSPEMVEAATRSLSELVEAFVSWYFESHPVRASQLGVHDHAGEYPALTRGGIQDRIDGLLGWLGRLESVRFDHLEEENRVRYAVLEYAIRSELLELEEVRSWARDPGLYLSTIAAGLESVVPSGQAAPSEAQLAGLRSRLLAAPAILEAGRENVSSSPRLWTELAIELAMDLEEYMRTGFVAALSDGGAGAVSSLDAARARLADALGSYGTWLRDDLLPRSNGDFRLGRYLLERKLLHDEHLAVSIEDLERLNEAAIREYHRWLAQTAARIDSTRSPRQVMDSIIEVRPEPDRLVEVATAEMRSARDWMVEAGVVPLDDPGLPRVRAGATHERFRFAWLDAPGPFEEDPGTATLTLAAPNPRWSEAERQEYLTYFNEAELVSVTLNQTFPGHAVQWAIGREVESPLLRMFAPRTLTEGWAHYAEQMALDAGYRSEDPVIRLTQLRRALQRHARWYAVVALHGRGAGIDEVVERFMTIAYSEEFPARRQVVRATWDPLYLASALGRMQIVELRKDVRARLEEDGDEAFDLAAFHGRLLELGLPLPLARDIMIPLEENPGPPRRR